MRSTLLIFLLIGLLQVFFLGLQIYKNSWFIKESFAVQRLEKTLQETRATRSRAQALNASLQSTQAIHTYATTQAHLVPIELKKITALTAHE